MTTIDLTSPILADEETGCTSASTSSVASELHRHQVELEQHQIEFQCQLEEMITSLQHRVESDLLIAFEIEQQKKEEGSSDTVMIDTEGEECKEQPRSSSPFPRADSSASSTDFLLSLISSLRGLESSHHASNASYIALLTSLRSQIDSQAESFVALQLQTEQRSEGTRKQCDEELSRIKLDELMAKEETQRAREMQFGKEAEWLKEREKIEEQSAATIAQLKKQAESVAMKLTMLSVSGSTALMAGEAEAIESGRGEIKRIMIRPSLAESQFLRMMGGQAYHVTGVEYIMNPPLLKQYHVFKKVLNEKGQPVAERLTFHGTSEESIDKIAVEGFRIGGMEVPARHNASLGRGIYSSESPIYAMHFVKGGNMMLSRVCPTADSVIEKVGNFIQQLVCKHREQIIPAYIVHYAQGARV